MRRNLPADIVLDGGEDLLGALDAAQLRQSPQANQLARSQPSRPILHHHFGAAGNRRPFSGCSGKQFQHRGQTARRHHLVRFSVTAHRPPARLMACSLVPLPRSPTRRCA